MSCGAGLAATCPSCGTENPPEAKFCIECGTGLSGAGEPATARPGPAPPEHLRPAQLPEERRKATVLFADLSGYTAVAERMDPEAVKSMVDRALRRLGEEVARFGGTVDKFIGDNVMAVFGAPVAHEDDPERAVRAGLAMQAAMAEINERIEGVEFALRVGINSGEVLAGQVGDGYTVIGDPVNVASRLQSAARPASVTVGEITHRLTRSSIEYVELEPLRLKGKSEPVAAWEAVRIAVAGTSLTRASTPLIGREEESEQLSSLFDKVVREERSHLVTVIGQAGVGKSRLLRELAAEVGERQDSPLMRVGRCPAYGSGLAYWALGEIVRDQFQIVDTDDSDAAWAKLRSGFEKLFAEGGGESEEPPERLAATIARPLGVEVPDEVAEGALLEGEDPQQTRARLFSAVRSLVEAAAPDPPAGAGDRGHPLGGRGNARPDRVPRALGQRPGADGLPRPRRAARPPRRVGRRAAERDHDRAGAPGPRPGPGPGPALLPGDEEECDSRVVAQVAERSGGNPLFAEEMVNRILEEGGQPGEALPETVHAVLAARLDALTPPSGPSSSTPP